MHTSTFFLPPHTCPRAIRYKRQRLLFNDLASVVQELRGNIQVNCRIRPFGVREGREGRDEGEQAVVRIDECRLMVDRGPNSKNEYSFDQVQSPPTLAPKFRLKSA